jgi:hypothetical protein
VAEREVFADVRRGELWGIKGCLEASEAVAFRPARSGWRSGHTYGLASPMQHPMVNIGLALRSVKALQPAVRFR